MILVAVFYTIGSLMVLRKKGNDDVRWNFYKQNILAILFHAVAYFVIILNNQTVEMLLFYLAQVLFFILFLTIYRAVYKNCYSPLLSNMVMLMAIGLPMLTRLGYDKAKKQFIIICASAILTLVVPKFVRKLKAAKVWAGTIGIIGLLLLTLVLVIGKISYGAKLSIGIGGFSFQPSEFVKISFVLMVAVLFRNRNDFKRVVFATGIAAVHVLVLVMSTDLGGALIFFVTYLCMLYVATKNSIYVFCGLASGSVAAVVAYQLFNHVRERVYAWRDPWSIIDDKGGQIAQSLFAIGTGGWFGSGLYLGMPNRIPVAIRDYTFSAISEEMGGIVAFCLTLICISCFIMFIKIASSINVKFYKLIGLGLATLYGVQVFLTIGGVTKFIPSTGVTLPLVSYGGSSILSTFILFGFMQGLYIMVQNEEERIEKRREIERKRAIERRKKVSERAGKERTGKSERTR